ncbi:acyltransferase [Massilia kyonggiensis]|nr:acyltransferase [Massilia kyonggiensis]
MSAAIVWLKAVGILFVVLHHFSRSLWLLTAMQPPPINQWQLFDAWVPLHGRVPYQPIFHWFFDWFARWGYVGVHMFMAASIIGHALGLERQTSSWAKFMFAKLRKIWLPAAVSVLFFSLLSGEIGWKGTLAKLFFVSYLFPDHFFAINSPLWFLVLVFQYYALLPLLRRVDLGSPMLWVASIVMAYTARWLLGAPEIASAHPYLAHACIVTWLPALPIGMALVRQRAGLGLPTPREGHAFGGLAVLLFAIFVAGQVLPVVYPLADSALTLAFVFLALACRSETVPKAIAAVSAASFYIYLYHRPLVTAALAQGLPLAGDRQDAWTWLGFAGLILAFTLFSGLFNWRQWKSLS